MKYPREGLKYPREGLKYPRGWKYIPSLEAVAKNEPVFFSGSSITITFTRQKEHGVFVW